MSDMNNNYDNQTPPDGNRPDYSYNWNGSEYNRKNNGGRGVAIVVVVCLLLAAIVAAVVLSQTVIGNGDTSRAESEAISLTSNGDSSKPPKKDNVVVPDFTPSGDADADLSTTLTQIYENCSPSCCTIKVSVRGTAYSIGSGFVIDAENGYIATNHHVIDSGDKIEVVFYNGNTYPAELVGSDAVTDIAVLKIEAKDLVQVEFSDSNNVKIGENVVAIGTPYDQSLAGTMTCGIISGIAREIDITNNSGKVIKTMTLLQTDCSINPGNSGGPLIDMAGNVVGITSLKLVDEQFEGIGFAIPITDAIDIFKKLIAGEAIVDSGIASASPKIGITCADVDTALASSYMRPTCEYPQGVFVVDIEFNCNAYMAGLDRYDIITDFNGDTVENLDELTESLAKYKAGDEVTLTVFRFNRNLSDGSYHVITFKLDAAS